MVVEKHAALAARRDDLAAELAAIDADLGADVASAPKRGRKPGKRGPGRPPKAGRKRRRRGPSRPPKKVGRPKGKGGERKAGAKGQSDLHNLIRSAMNGASEPMKAADIARKVVAAGYKSASKVFHLIVGQRLAEMKDVKKPERGLYALA
jgi:hypothetical protein